MGRSGSSNGLGGASRIILKRSSAAIRRSAASFSCASFSARSLADMRLSARGWNLSENRTTVLNVQNGRLTFLAFKALSPSSSPDMSLRFTDGRRCRGDLDAGAPAGLMDAREARLSAAPARGPPATSTWELPPALSSFSTSRVSGTPEKLCRRTSEYTADKPSSCACSSSSLFAGAARIFSATFSLASSKYCVSALDPFHPFFSASSICWITFTVFSDDVNMFQALSAATARSCPKTLEFCASFFLCCIISSSRTVLRFTMPARRSAILVSPQHRKNLSKRSPWILRTCLNVVAIASTG
mmetsp:Transcript_9393/g.23778  ORF Transcript_9393/g.23778 Transcript_9393/m.23778 type:complete len:300 (-) Transcript_9393:1566-2465(-)